MYEIETEDGNILKITGNHKVRMKSGEWKRVEDLSDSDELWDILIKDSWNAQKLKCSEILWKLKKKIHRWIQIKDYKG